MTERPFPASSVRPSVLFVDDDVNLLHGLQRSLRGQRDRWDMTFLENGGQALELMRQRPFDIVISDMRMPGMDGAALLAEIETRYPETVRIILSGYAEDRSIFRTVGPAHQYIAKPSDPQAIMDIMNRTLTLHRVLSQPGLRKLAAGLRRLPSPPGLYRQLAAEMNRKEASFASVSKIVAEDVAMTAQLLKITNSSYFAFATRITTAAQAIRLLGLEKVKTLVLSSGLFDHYTGQGSIAPLVTRLNGYSLVLADLAERLVKADGGDMTRQGQAFCAGMLCSIGMLVLLDAFPQRYPQLLAVTPIDKRDAAERQAFGAAQREVGAYLLGLWGFNDQVIEAVLFQSAPGDCPDPNPTILSYLHLARGLTPAFTVSAAGGTAERQSVPVDESYVARIGWWNKAEHWRKQFTSASGRENR